MYGLIFSLGICSAFASGSQPSEYLPATHSPTHIAEHTGRRPGRLLVPDNNCQKIVGCHYINNENEQIDPTLNIEMINVHICTHLFYSSVSIFHNASIDLDDKYADKGWRAYRRMNKLRRKNRRFKTFTTMGEYLHDDHGEAFENKILFDPNLREKLVRNIVAFLRKYKFNGIELDSRYLAEHEAVASDKQNFVLLLKALKERFDQNEFILALGVDGHEWDADNYDIAEISKYVSFINLRAFGYHGNSRFDQNRAKAGHVAPLYHSLREDAEERKLNVDYIVRYWLSKGAAPNKLILGTTFNGIQYTLVNKGIVGRGAPVLMDPRYAFRESCYYYTCRWENKRMKLPWTTLWDKQQQVPYLIRKRTMIAYENVASISLKAAYAKRMQLGGVFADTIEDDDFSGHCGGEEFTLLKAINRVLRGKC